MALAINLQNDYNVPAHPRVMAALAQAMGEKFEGYGLDERSEAARATVRRLIDDEAAAVHFLMGGTQTNLTALAAFLRPHEAIIAADSAHINGHETGAVEATGHKILSVPGTNGKLKACDLKPLMAAHTSEHLVKPRLLFISQATEFGTVYSRAELEELGAFCRQHGLLLYLDGARLGYALVSREADAGDREADAGDREADAGDREADAGGPPIDRHLPTLADLARITDAFYLGGTKNGALFGEALVIANPALQADFRYAMKQRGAMIAKGFLLGIQFEALLGEASDGIASGGASGDADGGASGGADGGASGDADGGASGASVSAPATPDLLYFELARQANRKAARLQEGLRAAGFRFEVETVTNQVFPIVSTRLATLLQQDLLFERWNQISADELSIRLVTTWLTTDQEVEAAIALLAR